jgi:hypothetical protein
MEEDKPMTAEEFHRVNLNKIGYKGDSLENISDDFKSRGTYIFADAYKDFHTKSLQEEITLLKNQLDQKNNLIKDIDNLLNQNKGLNYKQLNKDFDKLLISKTKKDLDAWLKLDIQRELEQRYKKGGGHNMGNCFLT